MSWVVFRTARLDWLAAIAVFYKSYNYTKQKKYEIFKIYLREDIAEVANSDTLIKCKTK